MQAAPGGGFGAGGGVLPLGVLARGRGARVLRGGRGGLDEGGAGAANQVGDLADLAGQGLEELAHVRAGLLGALGEELVGVGHDGARIFEPVVDGVNNALAVGGGGQQVAHAPDALEDRVRLAQEPGGQHEGAVLGARVRQREHGVGGGQAFDLDDVDVDAASPPTLVAFAAELALNPAGLGEKLVGGGDGRAHDDGVPVVGLGCLAGGQDGLGAHDRGDVLDLEALHVGQGLDRVHEGDGNVAEVAADSQHDAAGAQVRGAGGILLAGGGVFPSAPARGRRPLLLRGAGRLGAAVGLDLAGEHGAVLGLVNALEGQGEGQGLGLAGAHGHGHVGEGVVDGGVGLVDGDLRADHALVAHDARGDGFGQGFDQVDGVAGQDRHGLIRNVGVGDGGRDVVGRARGLDPHDDVGTEALFLGALEVVNAVVGQRPQSLEGDDDASATQRRSPFERWPRRWPRRRGPARPTRPLGRCGRRWLRCRCPRRRRGP